MCLGVAFALGDCGARHRASPRARRASHGVDRARCRGVCVQPAGPRAIAYSHDTCDYCRMTISDERFGGQFVTSKGKVHVFDSIECLAAFYLANGTSADGEQAWVTDYAKPGRWLQAERAVFARGDIRQSPMGLNVASFGADADTATIVAT